MHASEQALDAISVVRDNTNLRLRALGVIVNRMRPKLAEHKFRLSELQQAYPQLVLLPPVPERTVIQRAEGAGVPFHADKRMGSQVSAIFAELLDEIRRRAAPQTATAKRASGDAS